jgi:hypothetical protein
MFTYGIISEIKLPETDISDVLTGDVTVVTTLIQLTVAGKILIRSEAPSTKQI